MEKEFEYFCKTPEESSESELMDFYNLVLEGGKVQKEGLLSRIKNCTVLGYCKKADKIIGVSAIKRPLDSYKKKVISKAKLLIPIEKLEYEIGYSYTSPDFRRRGISANIKSNIIDWMGNIGGTIFSTTAIISSQNFLKKKGFKQLGSEFDGENDKNLKYFEITVSKLPND